MNNLIYIINVSRILSIVILLSVLSVSCTGMRPPGYHKESDVSKTETNDINNLQQHNSEQSDNVDFEEDFDLSMIDEFEDKIIKAENNNIIQSDETIAGEYIISDSSEEEILIPSDRLSTLDEQILQIQESNMKNQSSIANLEEKVVFIDSRLSSIENEIRNLKTKQTSTPKQQSMRQNNNIIQSDENSNQPQTVKASYSKPQQKIRNANESETNIDDDTKRMFEEGIKFYNAGKYSPAINTLEGISIDASDELYNSVRYYIAKSYFENQNYNAALKYLDMVINSQNNNFKPDAQILIAECHIKSGNPTKAKEIYKEFVSLYPANKYTPQARKMLQKL